MHRWLRTVLTCLPFRTDTSPEPPPRTTSATSYPSSPHRCRRTCCAWPIFRSGEHVIDVACGTGHVTRAAAERVGDTGTVTGIDIAPDMIEVAKSVPVPSGASVDWQISDAAALPIPDASADVVLCQMGLMFMEDRPAAISEMRQGAGAVRSGGDQHSGPDTAVIRIVERALVEHISADLGGFVSAVFLHARSGCVAALLREAGLREVSATVVTITLHAAAARRVPVDLHRPDSDGRIRRARLPPKRGRLWKVDSSKGRKRMSSTG